MYTVGVAYNESSFVIDHLWSHAYTHTFTHESGNATAIRNEILKYKNCLVRVEFEARMKLELPTSSSPTV